MTYRTLIGVGLAMVAGAGFAANGGMRHESSNQASSNAVKIGVNAPSSLEAQFKALDRNGDEVISRSEASANARLASMFGSINTKETIRGKAKHASNGITLNQYKAGMEAAAHGGVVGKSVSGGETYQVMKNGTKKMVNGMRENTQRMNHNARQSGERMEHGMHSNMHRMQRNADNTGHRMRQQGENVRRNTESNMNSANQSMQNAGHSMQNMAHPNRNTNTNTNRNTDSGY